MNCKECQLVLAEYFDRELDQAMSDAVSLHLENCEACVAEFELLTAEQEVFRAYAADVEVPQALWSGIQSRLESRSAPVKEKSWLQRLFAVPRVSVPATAVLVIAAVAMTAVLMKVMNAPEKQSQRESVAVGRTEPEQKVAPVTEIEKPAPKSDTSPRPITRRPTSVQVSQQTSAGKTAEQLVRDAEKKYIAAIQILSRDVGRSQSQIDPDTRMKLDQALASIDRTITETRKVVKQRPDDPLAAQYLLSAYARKVDALREMATGNF